MKHILFYYKSCQQTWLHGLVCFCAKETACWDTDNIWIGKIEEKLKKLLMTIANSSMCYLFSG
jgi:hypothetical protein